MSEDGDRCHACGRRACPGATDPVGGPFTLHNRAAYAALLERRRTTPEEPRR